MNKSHDYRALEREYVTSQISLRELCRRHGIRSHSPVVDQAKKHKWAEKREQYQATASDAYIEKHAARHADRLALIEDKAIDAIDQALDRFRDDMHSSGLTLRSRLSLMRDGRSKRTRSRSRKGRHQIGRCREVGAVAGLGGSDAQGDREDASMSVKPPLAGPPGGGRGYGRRSASSNP